MPIRVRVGALLTFEDGYLLERLENPKWPNNIGKHRPVGGRLEPGESMFEGLTREFREEMNVGLTADMLCGDWEPRFTMWNDKPLLTWVVKVCCPQLQPGCYYPLRAELCGDPYVRLVRVPDLSVLE